LKVPKVTGDEQVRRFLDEGRAAARLRHPNIVTVYEAGQQGDACYIASELIDGEPLSVRLERKPAGFKLIARWVRDLARALAYAHGERLAHRDIKPANVLIDSTTRPRLTDFGLARRLGERGDSAAGQAAGTPAYMAPEQARGDSHLGPAADIYALG